MTSLLVLLGLLSLAMLASRQGALDEVIARATTPVLVLFGLAISPAGLDFLTPSTLESLGTALVVGICWLALLAGLRASAALKRSSAPRPADVSGPVHKGPPRSVARAVALAFAAAVVASGIAALVLLSAAATGHPFVSAGSVAPAAVLVGASLAGMPGERHGTRARTAFAATAELVVLAAALGAFAAWSGAQETLVLVGFGVLGAVVVQLLLAPGDPAKVPAAVAYLSVATLVAGLARLAAVPGAVAGFVLGAVSGPFRGSDVVDKLLLTERPVRIVITVLLAASTTFDLADLVAGIILGVGAVLVQLGVSLALVDGRSLLERLAATVATSTTPLVAVAAFAEAHVDDAASLLPSVIIAVAVADAVAFTFSLAAHKQAPPMGHPSSAHVSGGDVHSGGSVRDHP